MDVPLTVYGADGCPDTQHTRQQLARLGVPYHYVNLDQDPAATERVKHWQHGKRRTPTVEFTVGQEVYRLTAPSEAELKAELEQAGLLATARKAG